MPDWTEHLRPRLAVLRLSASREAEIIEELSQHLDQRYDELRAGGATDAEARRLTVEELREPEARSRSTCERFVRRTSRRPSHRERPTGFSSAISGRICAMPRACCASSPASRPRPS